MSIEILSSRPAIEMNKALLKQGMDEYCAFRLHKLHALVPTSGSEEHDVSLDKLVSSALLSFREVIYKDVGLVESTGDALEQADEACALAMEAG
ncbi:MAG: hypothetical protein J6S63_03410 [Atopobiaceae bacterium]|nr:hypothetical protein [Atopobiaceae bacterium]